MVHSKTLFQDSNIFKKGSGKVEFINNEDLEPFYRGKKSKLAVGGLIDWAGGLSVD